MLEFFQVRYSYMKKKNTASLDVKFKHFLATQV